MKRVLALVLAFVMTMGLASVAFSEPMNDDSKLEGFVFNTLANGGGELSANYGAASNAAPNNKTNIFRLNNNRLEEVSGVRKQGQTIYIPLRYVGDPFGTNIGGDAMTTSEANKWKVRAEWDVNGHLVSEVSIEYLGYKADSKYTLGNNVWGYVVAIKTNNASITEIEDLCGTITVYRSSYRSAWDEQKVRLQPAGFGVTTKKLSTISEIEVDTNYVIDFDDDLEEESIEFQGVGLFEVNVKDQADMFLRFDLKNNDDITALYPGVKLDYVNFQASPTFNRWGVMYLYGEEADFLYVVMDGKMEAVDATWDASNDAWRFAAKRLGTFVIASEEIDVDAYNAAQAADEEGEGPEEGEDGLAPEDEVKPNPDTGR